MVRASTLALALAAAAGQVSAVKVEVMYGPYCPNSANYLMLHVKPFLAANLPNVQISMIPYVMDEGTPSEEQGSPLGVSAAPLCALDKYFPQMPMAPTPDYLSAMNFAICDLFHANHGAASIGLTHTPADIQQCASEAGLDMGALQACIDNPMADAAEYGSWKSDLGRGSAELRPGLVAPFIVVDGETIDNSVPLLTAVCAKMAGEPACANAAAGGYAKKFELSRQVPSFQSTPMMSGLALVAVAMGFLALVAARYLRAQHSDEAILLAPEDEEAADE